MQHFDFTYGKTKTSGDVNCWFIFLIGKTKNLQVKKIVEMTVSKVHFFTCRFLFSWSWKQKFYSSKYEQNILHWFLSKITEINIMLKYPRPCPKAHVILIQLKLVTSMVNKYLFQIILGHLCNQLHIGNWSFSWIWMFFQLILGKVGHVTNSNFSKTNRFWLTVLLPCL